MSTWRSALLFGWLLAAAAGCQQSNPSAADQATGPASPYVQDMDRICNSEERSGALEQPEGARAVAVAQWLGNNIQTAEAREFLVTLARTGPEDKAALIEKEAARAGLSDCPLVRRWRGAAEPTEPAAAPASDG